MRKNIFEFFNIGQSIPIFTFLSGYLLSKKIRNTDKICQVYFSYKNVSHILYKFIIPFTLLAVAQYLFLETSIKQIVVAGGALGSGGYYFFFYILLWILIPFLVFIHKKISVYINVILIVLMEIFLFNIGIPNEIYRFTPIRHLLLIYMGVVFQLNSITLGIYFKKSTPIYIHILLFISIYVMYCVVYQPHILLPNVLLPKTWVWFSYVTDTYTFLFISILITIHKYFPFKKLLLIIEFLGKYSLYVLLTHIGCITLIGNNNWKNFFFSILVALVLELYNKHQNILKVTKS